MDTLIEVTTNDVTNVVYGYKGNADMETTESVVALHAIVSGDALNTNVWVKLKENEQTGALERAGYVSRYDKATKQIDFGSFQRYPKTDMDKMSERMNQHCTLPNHVELHGCTLAEFEIITPIILNPTGRYYDDEFTYLHTY